jgi:hypothetical protein
VIERQNPIEHLPVDKLVTILNAARKGLGAIGGRSTPGSAGSREQIEGKIGQVEMELRRRVRRGECTLDEVTVPAGLVLAGGEEAAK